MSQRQHPESKKDLHGERSGEGGRMFRYFQDLIRLRRDSRAIRSHNIDIVHASNPNRVLAFTRSNGTSELLVVASLNNSAFENGYVIQTDGHRLAGGSGRRSSTATRLVRR